MQLDQINIGWKALATILNLVRKAVNCNEPLQGQGISLSKTDSGTLISLEPLSTDSEPPNVSPVVGWLTFTWNGVGWQNVNTVDPITCLTTSIQVLTKQDGQSIQVPLYFDSTNIQPGAPPSSTAPVISIQWVQP